MKRTLQSLILGLMLLLTGCRSDDAEVSRQENEVAVTASETSSAVSSETTQSSVVEISSSMTETTASQPDVIATETLPIMQDTDISETKSEDTTVIEETASQLETIPDDSPIEEDTGDFGDLFS